MKKSLTVSLVVLLCFLISCSETEKKTITSTSVAMIEEYAMEGSNTLTGVWEVDLAGINIDNIESAKVTSIKMEMVEPEKSDILAEIIMQLAASGTNMQRVALLNPVPENSSSIDLSIAEEQENLVDLLKQKEVTFVADVNLKEDPKGTISITTVIEFELEVKQ
ncbi:hypothetical protein SAMN05661096_03287 [Marivirga sericea]|uniref:Uncharacterized protein n=1 Tax=Marivirga sericea TaxID=1028 RepID=A0A1X7KZC9_9BACT|nr:hypothetical protein [Marivirga sericea]SMG46543.1 hypothetical protein SAMN05661096_03287 [Marivirga sericea]